MNTYRKFVKFRVVRDGGMGFRSSVYDLTDWMTEEEANKLFFQYGVKYGNDSDFQVLTRYELVNGMESKEFDKGKVIHRLIEDELYYFIHPYMEKDLRPEVDFCFPSGRTIINGYSQINISIDIEDFKPVEGKGYLLSNKGYYLIPIFDRDNNIFIYLVSNIDIKLLLNFGKDFTKKLNEIY